MSRRKKNLRAFLHAHPEFSIEQVAAAEFAWDSAWVAAQKVYHAKSMQELEAELSTLKAQNEALVDSLLQPPALEAAAKAVFESKSHPMLKKAGYPTDWKGQSPRIKKSLMVEAKRAIRAALAKCGEGE